MTLYMTDVYYFVVLQAAASFSYVSCLCSVLLYFISVILL